MVARARPAPLERRAGELSLVPVADGARRTAHPEVADLPGPDLGTRLVEQLDLISRDDLACCPITHIAGAVRQEDVEHLRGADAIEEFDARALLPAQAHVRGERLSCRDAGAE